MAEPSPKAPPHFARASAGSDDPAARAGPIPARTIIGAHEHAPESVDEPLRAAARRVVLGALYALERCFDLYGPAGFRVWIFVIPLFCFISLLDWLTGAPTWLSSLSLSLGAGSGLGYAAWSSWKR
jgi:hypothetical protein